MSVNDTISRREVIKQFGGSLLGTAPFYLVEGAQTTFLPTPATGVAHSLSDALQKPNMLWITREGVPVTVLSRYSGQLMKTSNIDRIASEGIRFANSFMTNAHCALGRATLLTGKYSHQNGMIANPADPTEGATSPKFDESQQTFPKMLKRFGYQTGIVGKWHLPANPGNCGFDYFAFKDGPGGPYDNPNGYLQNPSLGSRVVEPKGCPGYRTDTVIDLAINGIEKFRKLNQPFMMMVQFFNDHRPFDPSHKYEHLYDGQRISQPGTFGAITQSARRRPNMRTFGIWARRANQRPAEIGMNLENIYQT